MTDINCPANDLIHSRVWSRAELLIKSPARPPLLNLPFEIVPRTQIQESNQNVTASLDCDFNLISHWMKQFSVSQSGFENLFKLS